jgi:uncharacterized repeat protein (TIGR03803 family)
VKRVSLRVSISRFGRSGNRTARSLATLFFFLACWCYLPFALQTQANAAGWFYVRLASFETNHNAGVQPAVPVIEGADGGLYGTTFCGGSADAGTIFKLDKQGRNHTNLHSFTGFPGDGKWPRAPLLQAGNGLLYGTTQFGGSADLGTIFRVNPDGSGYLVIWNFTWSEGGYPYGGLIEGKDGFLYGTAESGGTEGKGTVFQVDMAGTNCMRLLSFGSTGNGAYPHAGLTEGSDGILYGTTSIGGTYGGGTVFKLNKDGTGYGVLKHFKNEEGFGLEAALLEGDDNALYGTTFNGGTNSGGTVFKVNKDGNGFAVIKHFDTVDGAFPVASLLKGSDGLLYGTTLIGGNGGAGVVFGLRQDGNNFEILRHFTGRHGDGAAPRASVIQAKDGTLYGTTAEGGDLNLGTVFALFPEPRSWITGWEAASNSIQTIIARGAANVSFGLQLTTNLEAAQWLTITTNTADAIGIVEFTKLPAETPQLFYRLVVP